MQYENPNRPPSSFNWQHMLRNNIPILVFLALATAGMLSVYWIFSPAENISADVVAGNFDENVEGLWAPIYKDLPDDPATQRLAQSPGPIRVGIIAGHKGFDSGAVCDDGLTEAQINFSIAQKMAAQLQAAGVRTEILDEFDARLDSYSATALIAIHADSCQYINELATGFKIAGSSYTDSAPLSICMEQAYQAATQMAYHEHTITLDMADYHAFREISPGTQAIIIEVGFMNLDRELLTDNSDLPVSGLADGVFCFLNASSVAVAP